MWKLLRPAALSQTSYYTNRVGRERLGSYRIGKKTYVKPRGRGSYVCFIYTRLSEPLICSLYIKSSSVSRADDRYSRLTLMMVLCAKYFQGLLIESFLYVNEA